MREFRYGSVDTVIYKWQAATAWFYDEDQGEFMEWDTWCDNQGMGYLYQTTKKDLNRIIGRDSL